MFDDESVKAYKYKDLDGKTLKMTVIDNEDGLVIGGRDMETGKLYIIFSNINKEGEQDEK